MGDGWTGSSGSRRTWIAPIRPVSSGLYLDDKVLRNYLAFMIEGTLSLPSPLSYLGARFAARRGLVRATPARPGTMKSGDP